MFAGPCQRRASSRNTKHDVTDNSREITYIHRAVFTAIIETLILDVLYYRKRTKGQYQ